ncbi:MAG: aldo/keto reductase [Cyclobacteriaceae bacterium]|nr:aldo/keto reductase [Cyclobacteriaceae bacterium HetDA_MAG_MS6]
MEKVKLGKSDVEITPIVFGAWAIGGWMWGGNDDRDAIEAIHASLDHGITTIDTAPIYGFGHSEKLVGEAIKSRSRDKVEILTKFCLRWDTDQGEFYFESKMNDGSSAKIMKYAGKDGIMKEVEDSLKRLGTDYIDLYQIHWHDNTTPISETMETLLKLQEQGKIRAAGVCNYNADQMGEAEQVVTLASNQVPYSMVVRDIEEDVVPYVQENGNGILAYSPLQRGLLTGKITSDYQFGEGDHRPSTKHFKEPNLSRVNEFLMKIKPIGEAHGATIGQLVINWTLQQPGITAALVGARNPAQVIQNGKSLAFTLSQEELDEINSELSKVAIESVS